MPTIQSHSSPAALQFRLVLLFILCNLHSVVLKPSFLHFVSVPELRLHNLGKLRIGNGPLAEIPTCTAREGTELPEVQAPFVSPSGS